MKITPKWLPEQDQILVSMYNLGKPYEEIVVVLNEKFPDNERTPQGCNSRIRRIYNKIKIKHLDYKDLKKIPEKFLTELHNQDITKKHSRWTKEQDRELTAAYETGLSGSDVIAIFNLKFPENERKTAEQCFKRLDLLKLKSKKARKPTMLEAMLQVMGERTMSAPEITKCLIEKGIAPESKNLVIYTSNVLNSRKKIFTCVRRGYFCVAQPDNLEKIKGKTIHNAKLLSYLLNHKKPKISMQSNSLNGVHKASFSIEGIGSITVSLEGGFSNIMLQEKANNFISEAIRSQKVT